MNSLMYVTWLLGPLLEASLIIVMLKRGAQGRYPRFFAYIVFQVLKSVVLFFVYHYFASNYFYAYWTGNALSVLLSVTVLDEIWRSLFRSYEGIQSLGSILFRWACALMFLMTIVGAINFQQSGADRVVSAMLALDRNMRQVQFGLFLLVLLLCRYLKNLWQDHVFGIALGFGVFAAVELVLVTFLSRFGDANIAVVSLIKSVAYIMVTLLWLGYLRRPEQLPVRQLQEASVWNNALITEPSVALNQPFLTMVEQAVERVLSHTAPWPKSVSKGSQIVSRKPQAEDCN